ncbi:MAG: hypothetical protein AUJ92_09920 [Armatimonadetes bacterium CG2_30_59_28]|nr:protoheme IX farnesyltransferase [Armatimonadota bacterium]OIO94515.1 MAG: hypothetical protein AUJ92_09920 [Armatimonadetes bacterium CG2_30_59_28]PIU61217.1 MAG: hypothetical protein COS85_21345 [Armatimonadetes bacterium CG07_land_8_20_14_0_80_59_28]PIX46199.1 MAG: hypothetical protein COZ56_00085 [Armatimonadetes bacterium CG_4_8_14_3_um_filter_58_9]PIY41322.1 MAG: hypothetical protein COZ05_15860 [Armatimonadetes bacterium CG_4_10_14_3_um_filter_59_10]
MKQHLALLLQLTKFRVAAVATLSAASGFAVRAGALSSRLGIPVIGVLLLACGALALNGYQERDVDALMPRTQHRPLAAGRMSPRDGLCVALSLIIAGLAVLGFGAGLVAVSLGLFAIAWYNGVYTPLKRWTAFAVVPGALIGAIPPMIGWVAAGGGLCEPGIVAIAFFFFIWQVPHFWLLLFRYGREYERAQLSSLTSVFTTDQLLRVTFIWILATAASCLLMPVFGLVSSQVTLILLLASTAWLVWCATRLFRPRGEQTTFFVFRSINTYALLVMLLLSLDRLIGPWTISIN